MGILRDVRFCGRDCVKVRMHSLGEAYRRDEVDELNEACKVDEAVVSHSGDEMGEDICLTCNKWCMDRMADRMADRKADHKADHKVDRTVVRTVEYMAGRRVDRKPDRKADHKVLRKVDHSVVMIDADTVHMCCSPRSPGRHNIPPRKALRNLLQSTGCP